MLAPGNKGQLGELVVGREVGNKNLTVHYNGMVLRFGYRGCNYIGIWIKHRRFVKTNIVLMDGLG